MVPPAWAISDNGMITEAVITQLNQPATTVTIEAGLG